MTDSGKPVTEEDLLAFADAQLSNGDAARVEAWLKTHPEEAARIRAWQHQNRDIQTMFAPYRVNREGDEAMLTSNPIEETPAKPWKIHAFQAAAAICIFALGVGVGRYAAFSSASEPLAQAVEVLLQCEGRAVVSGIGKSGHIGRKMAATLASTGTPSSCSASVPPGSFCSSRGCRSE